MGAQRYRLASRMTWFLTVAAAAVVFFSALAPAQVFLYGRAGFPIGSTNNYNSNYYLVVADFNGDGRPDLAISDTYNNWISVLLATSNGGYVSGGTYATGSSPTSLVAADFNGDKKPDLAVVNQNTGTVSILLGNGDGTFQSHTDYPVGENPVGLVAADFNNDGKIDLATISTSDSSMAIMLGQGDGTFEVQALIPVSAGPELLTAGDVNNDGKMDLITSSSYSAVITVLLSKGDGTFTQVASQGLSYPSSLTVGDFNRDGKLDLITESYSSTYLSLGNGDGSFQSASQITNAPYEYEAGVLAGDVNHDGKLDLVLNGVWIMLGNGDGTFENPVLSPAATNPAAIFDINGDGELDLVNVTNSATVAVLLGNGSGTFMDLRTVPLASGTNYAGVGVAADFNGDGKLDMAVTEPTYPNAQVSVELGKGDGTFKKPIVSSLATDSTNLVLAGDFNGDGKSDLLALDDNNNGFEVLFGAGNGSFGTPVDTSLSYSIYSLAVGDFNGDGKADVVDTVNSYYGSAMNVYLSNGDGTFSLGQQYVVYASSYVTVADVNHDGTLDLIVVGTDNGQYNLLVFLGKGDGTFQNPIFGPSDTYTSQAVVADFNGDGKLDIAVGASDYQSGGIAFLAGNGDGTFAAQVYSDSGYGFSGALLAADFNGDHKLDLLAPPGYNSGTVIMVGNGDGTFGAPQEYDSYNQYFSALPGLFGDFNSDGVSDLGIPGGTTNNTPVVFLYLSTPTPLLFPNALNFGSVQVGKTSAPKKVKLTNSGNSELKISSITVTGDFLEHNNCGKGLAIGKSCTLQVSFKPTAKGLRKGDVSVADNAPGSPQKIALQGTGK